MVRAAALLLMTCVFVCGCATYRQGRRGAWPEVIAHRGASAYAPENTLAAFDLARSQGADWFELDCTLSKDGEVIVIHDDTVDRTTDGEGAVRDLTLKELKRFDAGSWKEPKFAGERLPTLAEALDLAKGRIGVYIEIKDSDDDTRLQQRILDVCEGRTRLDKGARREVMRLIAASNTRNLELTRRVVGLVRERRMTQQVIIQSFSPIVCAIALIEAPRIRTEFLGKADDKDPAVWENYLRWGYLIGVDGYNTHYKSLTEGRLAAFRAAGRSVAVWTVNDEEDMRRFAAWGVDGIITDRPDVCRRAIHATRNGQNGRSMDRTVDTR